MNPTRRSFLHTASISLLASAAPALANPKQAKAKTLPAVLTADDLTAGLTSIGPAISDRKSWDALAKSDFGREVLADAKKQAHAADPDLSKSCYMGYYKTGSRLPYRTHLGRANGRAAIFFFAECLENKGQYRARLLHYIEMLCGMNTWVQPAHDGGHRCYDGTAINIDLNASGTGALLAMIHVTLGTTLPEKTRALIETNLQKRILTPYMQTLSGKRKMFWWQRGTNNWNAVCHGNVTYTALAMLTQPKQRLEVINAAIKNTKPFLSGFTAGGWCTEGPGYWYYGFEHYVLLGQTLMAATQGKIDLFDDDFVRKISAFGRNALIDTRHYPSFADCNVTTRPRKDLLTFLDAIYAPKAPTTLQPDRPSVIGMLCAFPPAARHPHADWPKRNSLPMRTFYPDAQVYIGRDAKSLALAAKGGHNNEHHNHNDVGTFLLLKNGTAMLIDPGAEVYTNKTFSSKRYESDALNSFGHSVPRPAGQLQPPGRKYAAKLIEKKFTIAGDTLTLDIKGAYRLKSLKTLTRKFSYSRSTDVVNIRDDFKFTAANSFETALILTGTWTLISDKPNSKTILIQAGRETLKVTIDASAPITISEQKLTADFRGIRPKRLVIAFRDKQAKGHIQFTCH